jgi:competence protein ComEC
MALWQTNRSHQITLATVALLGGILVGRLWPAGAWWVVAATLLLALPLLRLRLGLCVVVVLGFGIWRGATTTFDRTPLGRELGQEVTVVGVISDDPTVNDKNHTVLTVAVRQLGGQAVRQSLYLQTTNKPLQRGYTVAVSGKLTAGIGSVPAEMYFGQVTVLSTHTSWLERLRQRFLTGIRAALPDPMAGFSLGLLIGVRALISKPLQQTLNAVGLSHLVAVSGYNLTILIQAGRRVMARVSNFTATAASLWLIAGFLVVTGFSASIVRAAMVSGLSLWTRYYGYEVRPMVLVCLPALVTAAWKPDYLLDDVGWQLSFLAFFGIMVVAPLVQRRFGRRPNAITVLIIESTAAQATTAPLILAVFGNLSLVAPLANAVILPLVPLAMLLSFLTGAVAIVIPSAAAWIALPTAGLLALAIGVIQWFATWPDANLQLAVRWWEVAGLSAAVTAVTLILWMRVRRLEV